MMKRQCATPTRKGTLCPFEADRFDGKNWYCHLHDPNGTFRRQVRGELPKTSLKGTEIPPPKPTPAKKSKRRSRLGDGRPDYVAVPDDLFEDPPFEPTGVYDEQRWARYKAHNQGKD